MTTNVSASTYFGSGFRVDLVGRFEFPALFAWPVDGAGGLFSQGAFVHQYERYGISTQEMLSSFARYKTLLNSYQSTLFF